MGGERGSTTRKRLRGEICCICDRWIFTQLPLTPERLAELEKTPSFARGERVCPFCECKGQVHMIFFLRGSDTLGPADDADPKAEWVVQFNTPDGCRSFGRFYTFLGRDHGASIVRGLIARSRVVNARPSCTGVPWELEADLRHGRGGVTLQVEWHEFVRLTTRGTAFPVERAKTSLAERPAARL